MKPTYTGIDTRGRDIVIYAGQTFPGLIGGAYGALVTVDGKLSSSVSGCYSLQAAMRHAEEYFTWYFGRTA